MTREERRRRRENILLGICMTIVAVWIALLLLSGSAGAACEAAEAAAEPDKLTEALAVIGAVWVSRALMRVIEWLDRPRKKKGESPK